MTIEDSTVIKPVSTLLSLHRHNSQKVYPITGEMLIGRETDCHITLNSPNISRYHAKIMISPKGISIEDLLSAQGTYINGKRISNRTLLKAGDELRFDDIGFTLDSPKAGKAPSQDAKQRSDTQKETQRMSQPAPTDGLSELEDAIAQDLESMEAVISHQAPKHHKTSSSFIDNKMQMYDIDNFADSIERSTNPLSQSQLQHITQSSVQQEHELSVGQAPRLIITSGEDLNKEYALDIEGSKKQWTIGRDTMADIQLHGDTAIALDHAYIRLEDKGFVISTSRPTNGLLINGRFANSGLLKNDDVLQIGSVTVTYKNMKIEKAEPQSPLQTPANQTHKNLNISMLVSGIVVAAAFITAVVQSF